jgi:hypothetical protein
MSRTERPRYNQTVDIEKMLAELRAERDAVDEA